MGKFLGGFFLGIISGLLLSSIVFPDGIDEAASRLGPFINNFVATLP